LHSLFTFAVFLLGAFKGFFVAVFLAVFLGVRQRLGILHRLERLLRLLSHLSFLGQLCTVDPPLHFGLQGGKLLDIFYFKMKKKVFVLKKQVAAKKNDSCPTLESCLKKFGFHIE
jgi:hypothetical protein